MKFKALILALSFLATPPGLVFAGGVSVDSISGLPESGFIEDGTTLTIWIRMTNDYEATMVVIDNGFRVYDDPDGWLSWPPLTVANLGKNPLYNWDLSEGYPCLFDGGFYLNVFSDTVGFGGYVNAWGTGLEDGWDDWAYTITVGPIAVIEEPAALWIDSCFYREINEWLWGIEDVGPFAPDWAGPYHRATGADYAVEEIEGVSLPGEFGLKQNYPNPFNPNTIIQFDIPRRSHVSVVVYNTLGQKVRTLADEECGAGSFTVEWDGRNDQGAAVSSGVYLYRLEAGEYVQTKKAILMK